MINLRAVIVNHRTNRGVNLGYLKGSFVHSPSFSSVEEASSSLLIEENHGELSSTGKRWGVVVEKTSTS